MEIAMASKCLVLDSTI